jgi:hypothetical protein
MKNFVVKLRWKWQAFGVWNAIRTKNEFHPSLNLNFKILCCNDESLVEEYRNWIIEKRNLLHNLT